MPELPETCPGCGLERSSDTEPNRAFVPYRPDPNGRQARCEWAQDLPSLWAIVCMGCGRLFGVIDDQEREDLERSSDDYRVEEELT